MYANFARHIRSEQPPRWMGKREAYGVLLTNTNIKNIQYTMHIIGTMRIGTIEAITWVAGEYTYPNITLMGNIAAGSHIYIYIYG